MPNIKLTFYDTQVTFTVTDSKDPKISTCFYLK